MGKSVIVQPRPVPIDWVKLGSLVHDIWAPSQDKGFFQEPQETSDYHWSPFLGFKDLSRDASKPAIRVHLTQVLAEAFGKEKDQIRELEALEGRHYELIEPLAWFKKICSLEKAQQWLQATYSGGLGMYLVIGFRTLFDAKYVLKDKTGIKNTADINVPVDLVATLATGAPVDTGGMLDTGIGFDIDKAKELQLEYKTPGEHVYGLIYKKVKLSWLTGDPKTASLNKEPFWIDLTTKRAAGERPRHEQMVNATLSDRLGVFAMKVEEGDDEYLFSGTV